MKSTGKLRERLVLRHDARPLDWAVDKVVGWLGVSVQVRGLSAGTRQIGTNRPKESRQLDLLQLLVRAVGGRFEPTPIGDDARAGKDRPPSNADGSQQIVSNLFFELECQWGSKPRRNSPDERHRGLSRLMR